MEGEDWIRLDQISKLKQDLVTLLTLRELAGLGLQPLLPPAGGGDQEVQVVFGEVGDTAVHSGDEVVDIDVVVDTGADVAGHLVPQQDIGRPSGDGDNLEVQVEVQVQVEVEVQVEVQVQVQVQVKVQVQVQGTCRSHGQ